MQHPSLQPKAAVRDTQFLFTARKAASFTDHRFGNDIARMSSWVGEPASRELEMEHPSLSRDGVSASSSPALESRPTYSLRVEIENGMLFKKYQPSLERWSGAVHHP